jgi:probable phosphoglycerate mutase
LLTKLGNEFTNETVVAVCHAGVIIGSMRVLLDVRNPDADARIRPTHTGLTEWEHDQATGRWTLHSFNETSHLLGIPGNEIG